MIRIKDRAETSITVPSRDARLRLEDLENACYAARQAGADGRTPVEVVWVAPGESVIRITVQRKLA